MTSKDIKYRQWQEQIKIQIYDKCQNRFNIVQACYITAYRIYKDTKKKTILYTNTWIKNSTEHQLKTLQCPDDINVNQEPFKKKRPMKIKLTARYKLWGTSNIFPDLN